MWHLGSTLLNTIWPQIRATSALLSLVDTPDNSTVASSEPCLIVMKWKVAIQTDGDDEPGPHLTTVKGKAVIQSDSDDEPGMWTNLTPFAFLIIS
jgi:hypothetical protein